jgi:hypothetical protein
MLLIEDWYKVDPLLFCNTRQLVIFLCFLLKDDQIINWLLEFRSSVMYLTKDFEQLINIILVSTFYFTD